MSRYWLAVNICFVGTVFFYCHSDTAIMARFVFHAQDHNMTNGDFAIFTYRSSRNDNSDRMWEWYGRYVEGPYDVQRRRLAFYAVKQVFAFITAKRRLRFHLCPSVCLSLNYLFCFCSSSSASWYQMIC